ncbi:putative secreted protein [Lyophyllum shimeji]|uniref:Secreted protein n=1 Tax=Lyophyllum shimeji TaxID=47721 RepID=A0A9P3PDX3_LYOSH|nr:putative secreted protein [Lyophyllum shimeji]
MVNVYFFSAACIAVFQFISIPALAIINTASSARAIARSRYSRAHSLGSDYQFDPRDGWTTVNATNLQYKYRRNEQSLDNATSISDQQLGKRAPSSRVGLGETLGGVVSGIWKGIKAFGDPQTVTITWYTGHDLKNPSCWAQGNWAPTDKSFACALTLHGWHDRPECFKFLELCNGPKKCVFVRVVDSSFGELANFDQGVLAVQLRMATEPDHWYEDLWGPKHKR